MPTGKLRELLGQHRRIALGGFRCPGRFLAPFDDTEVATYLERRFAGDLERQAKAESLLGRLQSLRFRPLLLSYMPELLAQAKATGPQETLTSYEVFELLVDSWVCREVRKMEEQGIVIEPNLLWDICQGIALMLNESGSRLLTPENLLSVARQWERLKRIESLSLEGRTLLNRNSDGYRFAHYSVQEFLVAKALAEGDKGAASLESKVANFILHGPRSPQTFSFLSEILPPNSLLAATALQEPILGLILEALYAPTFRPTAASLTKPEYSLSLQVVRSETRRDRLVHFLFDIKRGVQLRNILAGRSPSENGYDPFAELHSRVGTLYRNVQGTSALGFRRGPSYFFSTARIPNAIKNDLSREAQMAADALSQRLRSILLQGRGWEDLVAVKYASVAAGEVALTFCRTVQDPMETECPPTPILPGSTTAAEVLRSPQV